MALLDRPVSVDLSEDDVVPFVEGKDVEKENLEFSPLVGYIEGQFNRAKDKRRADETRWLKSYRNYRGIYGPDVQFTDTEKSKVFVKLTKTKVLAAYAQVCDVLFAGGKFPIGIESPKVPVDVADAVHVDPKAPASPAKPKPELSSSVSRKSIQEMLGSWTSKLSDVKDQVQEGPGKTPTSLTFEPAKDAARKMEKKIQSQLEESDADKHIRSTAFEMALFGTGVMKGPLALDKEYPKWDAGGKYIPEKRLIPNVMNVSIWSIYPDPDARNMAEAEKMIERHRLSRTELRALKRRPHFRKESIEKAIELGVGYYPEYWEQILEDNAPTMGEIDRFEVLEYWGVLDKEIAEQTGLEIPKELEDMDQVQVNAWICNDQVLRLVLNPFTPANIPYYVVPYELNPYSFFGVGVAENMEDTQLLMNGFMRMAVDNAALSGNVIFEIDETNLVPGQDMSIYPGKMFRRQGGAPGQALWSQKVQNVSQELFMLFDKSRQLADESTGIPSYSHGQNGVSGVGRTASGMSMLMGAAAQNIKTVVRGIDDYLLRPLGKALFAFNMQFDFDPEYIGSLEVVAKGTESLMRNEIRSQKLLQLIQVASNPAMLPFLKIDTVLREFAASIDLEEDKIVNDPREAALQAMMMSQMAQLGGQGQEQGGSTGGPPPVSDPTGTGGGNIGPGAAPEPGAAGFTGAGGGANGGNAPPPM